MSTVFEISTATDSVLAEMALFVAPRAICLHPSGSRAYVADGVEIRVLDVLNALRGARRESFDGIDDVSKVLDAIGTEIERSPHNLTLGELIDRTG